MEKSSAASSRQNVSFKFTKHSGKRLLNDRLSDHRSEHQDREFVFSVEKKKIKSSVIKEEPKDLVIPSIENQLRKPKKETSSTAKPDDSPPKNLEELALKELLQDSAKEKEKWEKRDRSASAVPIVIQNNISDSSKADGELQEKSQAEESSLEDYEKIPIDEFGPALLRGLGCKPGDPIGNKKKRFVKPIEAVQRSKGLGLGADKREAKNSVQNQPKGEELKLAAGAYVYVTRGEYRGKYGQIEGLDETRAVIKIDKKSESISLPLLYVDVVSEKEYRKESKVINKQSYEKHKKEQEQRYNVKSEGDPACEENGIEHTLSQGISSEDVIETSRKSHHSEKHERSENLTGEHSDDEHPNWVCALLHVRIIDKNYKKGKYYKQKVIVEDVLTPDNCVCRTDDGKYLEGISQSMLETVIPRASLAHVMIVGGCYKGQLGIVLKRDKNNCEATVQLLSDREKVTKLSYNSICEYVGDVSQFE